jgi:hypothetical protein
VVAKIEFHPGELFPRVGFIATNRSLPNEQVLAFYNDRGKAEQHIKEGKYALSGRREASCGKIGRKRLGNRRTPDAVWPGVEAALSALDSQAHARDIGR